MNGPLFLAMFYSVAGVCAVAKGEQPAASITVRGHKYVPAREWQPIETAPKRGHILLDMGESIPDVPLVSAGSFVDEASASDLGEVFPASGGWLIWTTDADWYCISFADAHHWMPLPPPPSLAT